MNNYIIKKINLSIYYAYKHDKIINIKKIYKRNNELETLLNFYVNSIILKYPQKYHKQLSLLVNNVYNKCLVKNSIVKDEASLITDDLVEKILCFNKRNISLPIKVDLLKEYSISSIIKKMELDNVIKLIIIKLAIIDYFLNL